MNSITLGYAINSRLNTYLKLFTEKTIGKGSGLIPTFDTALKYLLTENIQLDASANIEQTQAADDFQPNVSLSMRFQPFERSLY